MEPIYVKIDTTVIDPLNFGYSVSYDQECRSMGKHAEEEYENNAQEICGLFILTENDEDPFYVANDREAADNALYHLAKRDAQEKIERIGTPEIIDTTGEQNQNDS